MIMIQSYEPARVGKIFDLGGHCNLMPPFVFMVEMSP